MKNFDELEKEIKPYLMKVILTLYEVPKGLSLESLALKLNVNKDQLKTWIDRSKDIFEVSKSGDQLIVSLPKKAWETYLSLSLLWKLKDPEKIEGGSEIFRKLMSVNNPKLRASYFYQLNDGSLIILVREKTESAFELFAFTSVRADQIEIKEGKLGINFGDPLVFGDMLFLNDLLGVKGEWEFLGFYLLQSPKNFVKEALESGGFRIDEIGEHSLKWRESMA
jgi:hypothetical protein